MVIALFLIVSRVKRTKRPTDYTTKLHGLKHKDEKNIMPAKPLMSWNKSQRRWEKMHRGNRYWVTCSALGLPEIQHNKEDSYQAANAWWEQNQSSLLLTMAIKRPHHRAIEELEERIDIARSLGMQRQVEKAQAELARVKMLPPDADTTLDEFTVQAVKDFEKYSGVSLTGVEPLVLRSFLSRDDAWREREKRIAVVPLDKTLSHQIDKWLRDKVTEARAGIRGHKNADDHKVHLAKFQEFVGGTNSVESITADVWNRWYVHCAGMVAKRDRNRQDGWDVETAKKVFGISKAFVRGIWKLEYLPTLPRNIDDKLHKFKRHDKAIPTFNNAEIRQLVTNAKGQHRLILLLMLNCGYTQKDVADLLKTEVDLKSGRITRRRSKTNKDESSRLVSHKLWPETLHLLREHINTDPTQPLALTTQSGKPWVWAETTDEGKLRKSDSVATVFVNLKKKLGLIRDGKGQKREKGKSLKVFRKTSATRIKSNKECSDLRYWFLGHSERTVADINYSANTQEQLDNAVDWLRTQYDLS